jgi:SpoVK/Ycf46/Vps4 family AAA+-type ATPase
VVLIDEVESFAVRRSSASFEANPVDVHRATDAVLLGIDEIAKKLPSVLFVTTTNFIEAVDEAFLSRADLVMRFQLPDRDTILRRSSRARSRSSRCSSPRWHRSRATARSSPSSPRLCEGWDGRRVRKLVLAALAQRLEVARDPRSSPRDDLFRGPQEGRRRMVGGAAPTSTEMFPDVPRS